MQYKDLLHNNVLLITGGTGSFGNAVLDRFLYTDHFREIRIFSRDEKKQHDMRVSLNNPKLKFYIGDVRDYNSIENAMRGVDYVFHAAALKQVPSCEFFPIEATKTNVFGTQNTINAAVENNVSKIICLSTDKAAYPINAMGISKALMEKVAIAASRNIQSKTTVCLTRYGNVMGSRGSVIPLFLQQIKNNEQITITDPNMTRFLMSLEEAVELVLYAFTHGNQGDLFVNKAPAGTIGDLAQALKELANAQNEIKIIGTRHGEKLYETLCTREEMQKAEDMGEFYRIPADNRDLNYNQYFSEGEEDISKVEDYHSHNTKQENVEGMKKLLSKLPLVRKEIYGETDRAAVSRLIEHKMVILINGQVHTDRRGSLTFFNDLNLSAVKRMYAIEHPNDAVVRAWLAHKFEQKWFYVIAGGFKVVTVKPDNWEAPSANLPYEEYDLQAGSNRILHIAGGYAMGFKALVPNSKMIVYSDFTVKESKEDDFRFDENLWYKWD